MIRPETVDPKRPSIWITRALPGASSTAALVGATGLTPLVAPLLIFRSLAASPIALGTGEALAFTSIQGVLEAAKRLQDRDAAIYAVGDATADAARSVGFSTVASAKGDVAALVDLIVASPPVGGVLHPGALETAGDLVGSLNIRGVAARKLALYRTQSPSTVPKEVGRALALNRLSGILIHSPKAGRTVATLLSKDGAALDAVAAFGLSESCLAPVRAFGFKAIVCAASPTETALITALARHTWPGP